jgi:hypothetical protein
MDEPLNPEIGQWYLHLDKGEMFRVSALHLERAGEPEDWTGPLDGIEVDELGPDTGMTAADWAQPLQPFPPQEETWQEVDPDDEPDPDMGDSK